MFPCLGSVHASMITSLPLNTASIGLLLAIWHRAPPENLDNLFDPSGTSGKLLWHMVIQSQIAMIRGLASC